MGNSMVSRWRAALFLFLFLGCSSAPDSPPSTTVTPLPERGFDLLGTAKKNIAAASPDTLNSAILLLSESAEGNSEMGRELLFFATALMERVYPLSLEKDVLHPAPVGSSYVALLEAVDQGEIPEIAQADVSFFTTLLTPLALLNSEAGAVYATSLETLERLIDLNPESVLPVYLRGLLAERKGNFDMALEFYRQAFEMDHSCYPVEIGAARIFIETGEFEKGLRLLERQLLRHPGEDSLIELLGEGYYRAGEYEKALEIVAPPLLKNPENIKYLLLKAQALERLGRYEAARKFFSVVKKELPGHPDVVILEARLLAASGELQRALEILVAEREAHPENLELENSYGELLLQSDRAEEGRDILHRQLEDSPENMDSLELLLRDAMKRGEWEAAEGYAESILDKGKTKEGLILAFEIARELGKAEKAEALITDLVNSHPGDAQAILLYGEFLVSRKDPAARDWLIAAVKGRLPSSIKSDLHYLISLTYQNEGSRIAFLRASLLENLENIRALLSLSRIYISRGEYKNAQNFLKQAESLVPENADVRRALEEVERGLR